MKTVFALIIAVPVVLGQGYDTGVRMCTDERNIITKLTCGIFSLRRRIFRQANSVDVR